MIDEKFKNMGDTDRESKSEPIRISKILPFIFVDD